jgi:hypothetical protein
MSVIIFTTADDGVPSLHDHDGSVWVSYQRIHFPIDGNLFVIRCGGTHKNMNNAQ